MPTWAAAILTAAIVAALWLAWAFAARRLMSGPRRDPHDLLDAAILTFLKVYLRAVHRVTYEGLDHLRAIESAIAEGRPVIVIANHTAGTDPLLVQNATWAFEIRWMMASDMRIKLLEPFWTWARIIDVERFAGDPTSARVALRHLATGGTIGIFPEGGIERPAEHLLPFLPGVGLLIKRSAALVLPALIDGTPRVDPAFAALWNPSRSRVRFGEPIDYAAAGLKPAAIVEDLQNRYADWSGWPLNTNRTDGVGQRPTAPAGNNADSTETAVTVPA
ncbi:MAG: lysophospholipid acyltransferase family protein [Planctomycetota bacterium]